MVKYNEIWNKAKEIKDIKFHSSPVYDKKYIKTKVKKIHGVVNINIWGNKSPKVGVRYTCIACISIDSVLKIEKNVRRM